jgi:hypothetical protein
MTTSLAASAAAGESIPQTGFVIVDGERRTVVPGDTFATGSRVADTDNSCMLPPFTIGADSNATLPRLEIVVRITDDCRLVADRLAKTSDSVDGLSTSSSVGIQSHVTHWLGAAWSQHYDCCGLKLTEVYAHMYYYDDTSSVYSGHDGYHSCWNALDGWYRNWEDYGWDPYGPDSVWIWTECSFSYIGGSYTHQHAAYFYGFAAGDFRIACTHTGGPVPQGEFRCDEDLQVA